MMSELDQIMATARRIVNAAKNNLLSIQDVEWLYKAAELQMPDYLLQDKAQFDSANDNQAVHLDPNLLEELLDLISSRVNNVSRTLMAIERPVNPLHAGGYEAEHIDEFSEEAAKTIQGRNKTQQTLNRLFRNGGRIDNPGYSRISRYIDGSLGHADPVCDSEHELTAQQLISIRYKALDQGYSIDDDDYVTALETAKARDEREARMKGTSLQPR